MLGWLPTIVIYAFAAMMIDLIYQIGRYDERRKMKKRAEEWLSRNPTVSEVHQFIESLAGKSDQG